MARPTNTIDFSSASYEVPFFSLHGYCTYARVVDLHDGDTITVVIPYQSKWTKFNVRLYGIDTCEINSTNETCKKLALQARDTLFEYITKEKPPSDMSSKAVRYYFSKNVNIVWIECLNFDKYQRLLAKVWANDTLLSDVLVRMNLAYPYYGNKRMSESQQLDYFLCNQEQNKLQK